MVVYSVISIALIVIEAAFAVYYLYQLIKRGENSLKEKGVSLIGNAVILYALYAMGLAYDISSGERVSVYEFVNVISCVKDVFGASISLQNSALLSDSGVYSAAFFIGVSFAYANFIYFLVSLVDFFFFRLRRRRKLLKSGCDVIIGYNENVETYLKNYEKCLVFLQKPPSAELKKQFRENKTAYISGDICEESFKKHFAHAVNNGKDFHFIALTEESETLKIIAVFKRFLKETEAENFYLYVNFDYKNYLSLNERILEDQKYTAFITCFNENELIARKFAENYPITRFAPDDFFDFQKGVIKEGKKFNVYYLGFGNVLSAVHRMSVMNDNLVTVASGKVAPLSVNYFAFDKVDRKNENKNSHFYDKRYFSSLEGYSEQEYFKTPEKIYRAEFLPLDLDHKDGDGNFKKIILENKNQYNVLFVSIGSDVGSIDYALKLVMFFNQNEVENYHIYVKVDSYQEEYDDFFDEKVTLFGDKQGVFNHEIIVDESLMAKAKSVNASYEEKKKQTMKWKSLSAIKKTSNVYSGLNLRLKLNLLGYDLQDGAVYDAKIKEEVVNKLKEGSPVGKKYEEYLFWNKKDFCAANALAYQEKLRWNAFYIVNGYAPMKKSDVKYEDGALVKEDDKKKLHACLTTVEGLDEYHKKVAETISEKEKIPYATALEKANTYVYDYSVIDVVESLNEKSKTVIVRR